MTVDEAITVLEQDWDEQISEGRPYLNDAVNLGLEALKEIKKGREGTFTLLLPGETASELEEV